jgi:transcriptional regulator with XRE-family HTH domain
MRGRLTRLGSLSAAIGTRCSLPIRRVSPRSVSCSGVRPNAVTTEVYVLAAIAYLLSSRDSSCAIIPNMERRDVLRWARGRAGLSQRRLAALAGVPQSTVSRIENGAIDPRVGTLRRLLRACGYELDARPRLGQGVDVSLIRERLSRTPRQRLEDLAFAAEQIDRIRSARRIG